MHCRRSLQPIRFISLLTATVCTGLLPQSSPGGEAAERSPGRQAESSSVSNNGAAPAAQQSEALEMFSAIAQGSKLGPGQAWFHAGESRYDWNWLARHYDADGDERISGEEFEQAALLNELDRNGDGAVRPRDFDWSDEAPYVRKMNQIEQFFRKVDSSSNGRISQDEWSAYFSEIASRDKEGITPRDLRAAVFPPPRKRGNRGPSRLKLLRGLLKGEIGSLHEGPDVGDDAPEFELETQDGERTIRLSDYRSERPVVLIFGSFT